MPASTFTYAVIASALGGVDPKNVDAVNVFYVDVFPRCSAKIRRLVFDWVSSHDRDPTQTEISEFLKLLTSRSDFRVLSDGNPYYDVPREAAEKSGNPVHAGKLHAHG